MFRQKRNFYITTTLPYVNAEPHLGFALEIVQADVLARWHRQRGDEVFFNTGTDEHGLKIFRQAQREKMDVQHYCDIYARKFENLKEALNLSYNSFIRTTEKRHEEATQEFWRLCLKKGDIYKKNYRVKYCVGCELEKTESELENGRCPFHPQQELEIIEEENYFFRYSRYQKKLLELYEKNPQFVVPASRLNEVKEFTKRGLEDFSISRLKEKMPWGIPVPGDDKHVMYVWFDALINYISSLGWPTAEKTFKDFWPGIQVAGKDNLRQQSSMWQAMLMSAGLPTSKQILIHGFVTANGQKMSKTLGNVVNPFVLVEKYGTDAVRYFLLREFSPFEDGDFTREKFEQRYKADLANGLGNLVARVLKLSQLMSFSYPLQDCSAKSFLSFLSFGGWGGFHFGLALKKAGQDYEKAMVSFKFNEALAALWGLINFCDRYLSEKKPWQGGEGAAQAVKNTLKALAVIAEWLFPFLPQTAEKIKERLRTGRDKELLFPPLS